MSMQKGHSFSFQSNSLFEFSLNLSNVPSLVRVSASFDSFFFLFLLVGRLLGGQKFTRCKFVQSNLKWATKSVERRKTGKGFRGRPFKSTTSKTGLGFKYARLHNPSDSFARLKIATLSTNNRASFPFRLLSVVF